MLLICAHCGKTFFRKNWSEKKQATKHLSHVFCSRECTYASPLRLKAIRDDRLSKRNLPNITLSDLEIGYIAGLIDGEGSFNLHKGHRSMNTSLVVAMCHKPTLEKIQSVTGVGTINKHPYRTGATQQLWRWGMYSKIDLYIFLPLIIPAMIAKKTQAELLYEFCVRRVNGIPYDEREEIIASSIKSENHRRYD